MSSIDTVSPTSSPPYDAETIAAQKRLVFKLDFTILPLFTFIATLINVDRYSIGNAQIAGMPEELGLSDYDLSIALTTFFAIYAIMKIPSNLVVKRLGSTWISFLVIATGCVSVGTAFTKNSTDFLLSRVFLGMTEGGIAGGLTYLLARYYRRHELVLRLAVFFGLAPILAGAFAGLISFSLLSAPDMGPIKGWRKIFFAEGLITIGIGLLGLTFLPSDPSSSRFLSHSERALAIKRIDMDSAVKTGGQKERTTVRLVLRSFNIWTCICTFCFVLLNISYQGMNVFLPTIIQRLGHISTSHTQLATIPVYLIGAGWMLLSSYFSFQLQNRFIPTLISTILHVIGYTIALSTSSFLARYAGCVITYMGDCAAGVLIMTWATDNAAPDTMRAVTSAAIPGLGALGSVVGMWVFIPSEAPSFHAGNLLNLLSGITMSLLLACGVLYLENENNRRDRGERDYRLDGKNQEAIQSLGYRHPNFRYQV